MAHPCRPPSPARILNQKTPPEGIPFRFRQVEIRSKEAAENFSCSVRTIQHWIKRIETEYPGVKIEHLWDDEGTKRFRKYVDSKLHIDCSFGQKDILALWALALAVHMLRDRGLHDDAEALDSLSASLIKNAPRAHLIEINRQLDLLRISENIQTSDAGNHYAHGVANKLRIAVIQDRHVTVTTGSGNQLRGRVAGLNHTREIGARLITQDGEIDVPIAEIMAIVGVDDLIHTAFAMAA